MKLLEIYTTDLFTPEKNLNNKVTCQLKYVQNAHNHTTLLIKSIIYIFTVQDITRYETHDADIENNN